MFNIHSELYPENYDFLTNEQQELILSVYNQVYGSNIFEDFMDLMHTFNIFVEDDWAGHYSPFLATYEDAEIQNEVIWSQMECDD